jgi:AraC-like DNA-binding protein
VLNAAELGFEDTNLFSKFFKKLTDYTPMEFKKRNPVSLPGTDPTPQL